MARKPSTTVVVVDPIPRIDAAMADLRQRRAALDHRAATCTAAELVAEGVAISKAQAEIDRQLAQKTEQRIAAIAGLPVDLGPPRKAETPRAPALPPLARRLNLPAVGDEPEEDVRAGMAAAADFLEQIDQAARKTWGDKAAGLVSVTRGHMYGVDFGLALLRSLQRAADLREKALEARIAELEARVGPGAALRYFGSYQRAQDYPQGAAVSDGGNLFIALRDVAEGELPRDCPDAWQLAVRRGRDGKDAEPQRKSPTIRYSASAEGEKS